MAQTWQQKLNAKKEPKLQVTQKAMPGVPAGGQLFFPTPQLIKQFIDQIPRGNSVTLAEIRQQVAQTHKGDGCCPLTTSTATRIVAEAAWEEIESGKKPEQVTPFWRLIEPGSSIAQKLACGSDFIEDMRQQEGID
jgi:hypothetical protein